MMRGLGDLWSGRLPLAVAFWTHAVLIGIAVNIAATAGTLVALAADLPTAVAIAIHLSPLPYNVAIVIGVWRSADRYSGPRRHGETARIAVLALAVFLTLM